MCFVDDLVCIDDDAADVCVCIAVLGVNVCFVDDLVCIDEAAADVDMGNATSVVGLVSAGLF